MDRWMDDFSLVGDISHLQHYTHTTEYRVRGKFNLGTKCRNRVEARKNGQTHTQTHTHINSLKERGRTLTDEERSWMFNLTSSPKNKREREVMDSQRKKKHKRLQKN